MLQKSHELHDEAARVLTAIFGTLLALYVADAHRWPLLLQETLYSLVFLALCVALLLLVTETPYGPLCVMTVLLPLSYVGLKFTLYKDVPASLYTSWIYRVLVAQGLLVTAVFFAWACQNDNMWDSTTRAYYSDRAFCEVNYQDLDECRRDDSTADNIPCFWKTEEKLAVEFNSICTTQCLDVYEECTEAFIMWSNPGLAAMALLSLGFIAKYLKPDDPHSIKGVSAVARIVAIFLFLLWIFASMAGAGEGLSNNLIAFAISLVIGSTIVVAALFWQTVHDKSNKELQEVRKQASGYKDILKGLVILAFLPVLVGYVCLSVVNQAIRRLLVSCCPCVIYTEEEKEHRGYVTKYVSRQIEDFMCWDHSKVLTYAIYWGFGYIFFNVLAAKFTTLFLSWLIEATATMNVLAVTGIVFGVGMILFMFPPIPGIPIYLTAGIVLVSVGESDMGLWGAIAYASAVSFFIKLFACVVQQVSAKRGVRRHSIYRFPARNDESDTNLCFGMFGDRNSLVNCLVDLLLFAKWWESTRKESAQCEWFCPLPDFQ